jgi:hypothetical protein
MLSAIVSRKLCNIVARIETPATSGIRERAVELRRERGPRGDTRPDRPAFVEHPVERADVHVRGGAERLVDGLRATMLRPDATLP